jgi:Flp pilus assembly pilin Flp
MRRALWPDEVEDKFLTTNLLGEREMKMLKRFLKDERGLEGSEYALLLALLCLALVVTIGLLRDAIANAFTRGSEVIQNATDSAG